MRNYWLISDTHFSHANMLKFMREDGTRVRPEFETVEEMDEIMIANWNAVVRPQDYILHCGDVCFDYEKWDRNIAPRLMGHKRLVVGNHDRLKGTPLMNHFEKVELWKRFDEQGILATHLPAHKDAITFKYTRNVHGHIHYKTLKSPVHANISVERTGYKPVNLDEIDRYFG
jgi:calcineurin-like phosphoesterase family protein